MTNESITVRLSPNDIEMIDRKVSEGRFTNRSDAIRFSLRHFLMGLEEKERNLLILADMASSKGIDGSGVRKAVRKVHSELHVELHGND